MSTRVLILVISFLSQPAAAQWLAPQRVTENPKSVGRTLLVYYANEADAEAFERLAGYADQIPGERYQVLARKLRAEAARFPSVVKTETEHLRGRVAADSNLALAIFTNEATLRGEFRFMAFGSDRVETKHWQPYKSQLPTAMTLSTS